MMKRSSLSKGWPGSVEKEKKLPTHSTFPSISWSASNRELFILLPPLEALKSNSASLFKYLLLAFRGKKAEQERRENGERVEVPWGRSRWWIKQSIIDERDILSSLFPPLLLVITWLTSLWRNYFDSSFHASLRDQSRSLTNTAGADLLSFICCSCPSRAEKRSKKRN